MENLSRAFRLGMDKQGGGDMGFFHLFVSKRLIQGSAAALTSIFVPIFLYTSFDEQFYIVGVYFAGLSFLYAALLVPSMQITNRLGFSKALVLGGCFSVLQFSTMYFLKPANALLLLVPLTIAIVGFRLFHWVPYHVDFTLFTNKGERGRMVSLSFATIAFMGVVGPILAGFIVQNAGYEALFGTAVLMLVAATISYWYVPDTKVHFDWTYKETLAKVFSKDYRGIAIGEAANGAEVAFTLIVWPIFLYKVLNGDVFSIGVISTVIVAITIGLQLFVGKYLDGKKGANEKTLRVGSTLYAIGWILKIFVFSTAQVFFVGLYHNIVKIFTKTPFSAIVYDMSAEQGSYVDEFTVVREMSGHTGRCIGLLLVSVLTLHIPIGWTFVIAALASLALNAVYRASHN